jgi:two-component system, NarL family, response regulator YdfI
MNSTSPISVAIAAANAIVRVGLESIIRTRPTLEIVSSASGEEALLDRVQELQPDAVLLDVGVIEDLSLAGETLWEKLLDLGGANAPAIVLLADNFDRAWVADALAAGVRGILVRAAAAEEIVSAIEAAVAGLIVLHPDILDVLGSIDSGISRTLPAAPLQALSPREIEVLRMLAEGSGNKSIAKKLNISEHTVKFHVSSIFQKLNASTRTEAVTVGVRMGLILL